MHTRAQGKFQLKRREKQSEDDIGWDENEPVYMYSSQKLKYTEIQKKKLREAVFRSDKHYTYHADYLASSVGLNLKEIQELEREQQKAKILVPGGFRLPGRKSSEELNKHPKKPHPARVHALNEPFMELKANESGMCLIPCMCT